MGLRKVNTTAYHPQGDGLVERFNRTLTVEDRRQERDWDDRLPYTTLVCRNPHKSLHSTYSMDVCQRFLFRLYSLCARGAGQTRDI